MNNTYFEVDIKQVDFLNDYEKTIAEIKKQIHANSRVLNISLSTRDDYDEQFYYLEIFSSFDEMEQKFNVSDYEIINDIDVLILNPDNLSIGIYIDKSRKKFFIFHERIGEKKGENQRPSKKELREMIEESEKNKKGTTKEDNCTYYLFDNNIYGKYDPETSSYYILRENGDWEVSGAVFRWVIDPAYDYEEVNNPIKKGMIGK